jgi:hypothetical protein
MAHTNAAELCDAQTADRLTERLDDLCSHIQDLAPVYVDARLHPWKWRRRADGGFYKTDALDHAEGHDLIGCQDVAWDIAGGAVEFALSPEETARLADIVGRRGRRTVDLTAIAAFRICYAAFQGGAWRLALSTAAAQDAEPVRRQVERYTLALRRAAGATERTRRWSYPTGGQAAVNEAPRWS